MTIEKEIRKNVENYKDHLSRVLIVVAAYEVVLFTWAIVSEHKAKRLTELVATLKPGETTKDSAITLFQAHRWNVKVVSNACPTREVRVKR
jgi:hypothetical protein